MQTVSAPPLRVALVDANGLITREWANFIRELYVRNGGYEAPSNGELNVDLTPFEGLLQQPPPRPVEFPDQLGEAAQLRALISDLQQQLDGLMQGPT